MKFSLSTLSVGFDMANTNRPSPDQISRAVDLRDGLRALQRVAYAVDRSQNITASGVFQILTPIDAIEVEHKIPEVIAFLQEVLQHLENNQ